MKILRRKKEKQEVKTKEKENKEEVLKNLFKGILWMAIRYAHGRHTCAPDIVRRVVFKFKELYPDFTMLKDCSIKPPSRKEIEEPANMRSDWLDDLFKDSVL